MEQLFNCSGNRRGYCAHPKDAYGMWNSEDGLFQRQVALLFLGALKMDDHSGSNDSLKLKKMELLQSGVAVLYQDKLLCDVQLQAEGKIFSAHKTILAAVTDYFRAMFAGGYKESTEMDKPKITQVEKDGTASVGSFSTLSRQVIV